MDGAGDVFIGDTNNNRVVEVPAGGGAQITVRASVCMTRTVLRWMERAISLSRMPVTTE